MNFKKFHSKNEVNIFTEIGKLASEFNAVNLSQGSPDYDLGDEMKKFLMEGIHTDLTQYCATSILPDLEKNLLNFIARRPIPIHVFNKEIAVSIGATYSLYVSLATFLEAGDEVIVLEPCYETYEPAIGIRNAIPVYVPMDENFEPNWQKIKDSITEKTAAIIINSPHNPSGKLWEEKDWNQLWEIIKDTKIIVISDEVYQVITYDGKPHYSAFHHPEIKERCFCIYSFEKIFHISGWKASYIIANEKFVKCFNNIHQYLSFTINVYAQFALAKGLEIFDIEKNIQFFERKRDLFCDLMKDSPFQISEKTQGGYFQTVDFSEFSKGISDKDFSISLIKNFKIASIPYSAFYHNHKNTGKLRFCFAKKDETLLLAAENLQELLKKAPLS